MKKSPVSETDASMNKVQRQYSKDNKSHFTFKEEINKQITPTNCLRWELSGLEGRAPATLVSQVVVSR